MNIALAHARATLTAAASRDHWWKAALLTLSTGIGLASGSVCAPAPSMGAAFAADRVALWLLFFGLSLAAVPLWRGLLWTAPGPAMLPIRPPLAAAIEGLVFAALSQLPLVAFWLAFGWNLAGSEAELSWLPAIATAVPYLACAPFVAQLRGRAAHPAVWVMIALPGLAGAALIVGLGSDAPDGLLVLFATVMSVFLMVVALLGASAIARRLTRSHAGSSDGSDAEARPGRLDRLHHDTRLELARGFCTSALLTLGAWLLLDACVHWLIDGALSGAHPLRSSWGGILVVLPLLPRLQLTSSQLGVRLSEVPRPDAWSLLPVDPDGLRRRVAILMAAPLGGGALVDIGVCIVQPDPLGWLQSIALVHIAASIVCGVVLGGLAWRRLPRTARS